MSRRFSNIRNHDASVTIESGDLFDPQTTASHSEPRSIRRSRSLASSSVQSSSVSQKTPARSFVHHASVSGADAAPYASQGVRQQTAEIASWALTPSSPTHPGSQRDTSGRHSDSYFANKDAPDIRRSPELSRTAVIEEASEPVTPEEDLAHKAASPRSIHKSGLANMFQPSARRLSKHSSRSGISQQARPRRSSLLFDDPTEHTPLLQKSQEADSEQEEDLKADGDIEGQDSPRKKPNTLQSLARDGRRRCTAFTGTVTNPKSWSTRAIWQFGVKEPASLIPCVFLGVLLNVLDALSYGMILFPLGEPIFANTGPDGISMFYVSCIVSQLVYSCGGSIFKGGVGSEMIEVVPFFHKMTYTIIKTTGTDRPDVVLATVITSYAISSVLTGLVFALLGAFKLGSLVNFFPRHILIGCIGGVGFFLFVTGIEVSARLDGNLEYTLDTARQLVRSDTVLLWVIPLLLSILLMIIKYFKQSPYIVPAYFVSIAAVFYIVVTATASLHLSDLRDKGWVFAKVQAGVPFYHFYSYYDFGAVDWKALAKTIPAMFALTFFGILHVPINIPALAIAAQEDDLDLNRELVAHGISNALSGFCGSIQNYLVYVNSEMFISNGGNNRLAGLMLAAATTGVLIAGPGMIGFVPIMVVGALIFFLGIELLQEALWETLGKMNKLEYLTVLAIVLTMGIYDFVGGILVGIVLACLNFVVQTSRKSAIRTTYSGEIVESTVRRHHVQRHYLHEVGYQIHVTKLAGMLFFGSIVQVEKQSRALIEEEAFRREPIRYLVFDFAHVTGIDYSAAEAFTRMERILGRRDVRMIISGVNRNDDVGKGLNSVGLWSDDSSVEFFENLNLALESCENRLLTTFYRQRDVVSGAQEPAYHGQEQSQTAHLDIPNSESGSGSENSTLLDVPPQDSITLPGAPANASPRQLYLQRAATSTLSTQTSALPKSKWSNFKPPLPLLLHCFQNLSSRTEDFWFRAVPYFSGATHPPGTVLFRRGDTADAFYLLQSGMLRATYSLPVGAYHERIVAGTTCGELPFFSGTPRTATVRVEGDDAHHVPEYGSNGNKGAVVWKLDSAAWARMRSEWSEGAEELLGVALRLTKERVDAVTSYVLTAAG